jgi:CHASE3 domain sensor protein
MTALDPEHPNPIENKSDRELVRNADAYSEMEMSRRLKKSISDQTASLLKSQQTTNDLTASIKTLTIVLVVLTVLIALLTVVMAWPTVAGWFTKASGR